MSRHFECLDCGALMTTSSGSNPRQFVTPDGHAVGCLFCGSVRYKPLLEQLPPEKPEAAV